MDEYAIHPLHAGSRARLAPLIEASVGEGFRFLARLRDEYESGESRFDREGEVLLGVFRADELLAVGGLIRDPYGGIAGTGRVRHVYVLPPARRAGIGRALMEALLANAGRWYDQLVLRTDTQAAARFYEALGFAPEAAVAGATHRLRLAGGHPAPPSAVPDPGLPGTRRRA